MYGNHSNLPKEANDLLSLINQNMLGILWSTGENHLSYEKYYSTLDYLFNGLITKRLKTTFEFSPPHLFMGSNFGNPFFLGQVNADVKSFQENIKQTLVIASNLSFIGRRILLLGNWDSDRTSSIEQTYPEFDFVKVESI